jgi:predicted aspartyl protease
MSPEGSLEGVSFGKHPAVFVRITGRAGGVREFKALVDPCAEYCLIPKVDAYVLGYPEAANDDPITPQNNTVTFAGLAGYGQTALIQIARVEVGPMSFENVEFAALDLPQVTGFDVVLGRSLLQHMKVEFDYSTPQLRIEDSRRGGT